MVRCVFSELHSSKQRDGRYPSTWLEFQPEACGAGKGADALVTASDVKHVATWD